MLQHRHDHELFRGRNRQSRLAESQGDIENLPVVGRHAADANAARVESLGYAVDDDDSLREV